MVQRMWTALGLKPPRVPYELTRNPPAVERQRDESVRWLWLPRRPGGSRGEPRRPTSPPWHVRTGPCRYARDRAQAGSASLLVTVWSTGGRRSRGARVRSVDRAIRTTAPSLGAPFCGGYGHATSPSAGLGGWTTPVISPTSRPGVVRRPATAHHAARVALPCCVAPPRRPLGSLLAHPCRRPSRVRATRAGRSVIHGFIGPGIRPLPPMSLEVYGYTAGRFTAPGCSDGRLTTAHALIRRSTSPVAPASLRHRQLSPASQYV
jgi:hypothetical protein